MCRRLLSRHHAVSDLSSLTEVKQRPVVDFEGVGETEARRSGAGAGLFAPQRCVYA